MSPPLTTGASPRERQPRALLAGAVAAALCVALAAACDAGPAARPADPGPTAAPIGTAAPAPTATATPTAPTPAPTPEATPRQMPTPTAEPTPTATATAEARLERQCENGTAVPDPAANPALVAECVVLLGLRDKLRASEPLNWSAGLPMTRWEGVTVGGEPRRVLGLDLASRGLTGSIPPDLGNLEALTSLFLSENTFTGCVPRGLHAAANHDLDHLAIDACPLPSTALSYDTYDMTGEVTEPGSYAFMAEDGSVVTTYEALRDGSATRLRIHATDAGGTTRKGF